MITWLAGVPQQSTTVKKNMSLWLELKPYVSFKVSDKAINICRQ